MHEALLSRALLPAPTVVLGLELRPYSLGHELLLIRDNNPLAYADNPPVNRGALERAALICSSTFAQAQALDVWLSLKVIIWRRYWRRLDTAAEVEKFRAYQKEGALEFPLSNTPRPDRHGTARVSGAPFLLRLYLFLTTQARIAPAEAWNYPVGLAKMLWQAHHEEAGALDLYNIHDAEYDRQVAELKAREAASQAESQKGDKCPA